MTSSLHPWLDSPAAFADFVEAWTTCTLPKSNWTHPAHVAIAAHCVSTDPWSALARLREGIKRYNLSIGGLNTDSSGYHETLTRLLDPRRHPRPRRSSPQPPTSKPPASPSPPWGTTALSSATTTAGTPLTSRAARATWFAPDRVGPLGPLE